MRLTPLAFALALCLAVVPSAGAAPASSLALQGPALVTAQGNATVPLGVDLTLSGFDCVAEANVTVALLVSTSGATAALDDAIVNFTLPAGSHAFDSWSGHATVNLTVATDASGLVDVNATFMDDGSTCIAPGGFPDAAANLTIQVTSPAPAEAVEPTPATPTSATPTPSTPTPPTADETPATPTSSANGSVDRLPPGGGYISDYKPDESRGLPGPAVGLVVAGAVAAATLMRRRAP